MKHEGVVTADILQWTCLVLAVLKAPLLVRRKRDFQPTRHTLGKLPAALQTE
jgi:peptidoglycan biosynthesis protein MviN/MurJ (putative lipid II flippase)